MSAPTCCYEFYLVSKKDIKEFVEILKAETAALTYDQVYHQDNYVNLEFHFNEPYDISTYDMPDVSTMYMHFSMSENHAKSIEWIEEWRKNNQ